MSYPTVISPAYGRDYKNQKEVLADFNANKDFVIEDIFSGDSGRYINKEQFPVGATVQIRYGKMMKLVMVNVKE